VLFTDGISESMNSDDEEWGEERLIVIEKATVLQINRRPIAVEVAPITWE
jgi:hypothetical protein